jgi:FkbM family methyltransferase
MMRRDWTGAFCAVLLLGAGAQAQEKAAAPRRDILNTEKREYSQHDEELVIRDFFQDKRKGTYLDVGCAWPIKDSNTFYLEHRLGWTGVGVDALPDYADAWKKRRKKSRFLQYAVTDKPGGSISFFRSEFLGISMLKPSEEHLKQGVKYEEIKVQTTTLDRILEEAGVQTIDFLSMDIEGAEIAALAGFSIERYKPALACVEAKPENREKLLAYFAAHGYEQLQQYAKRDPVNNYYAPKAKTAAVR